MPALIRDPNILRRDAQFYSAHARRAVPMHRRPAFTVVELLIVLIIIAIFAGIAVPRYATFLARERVDAAANRIAADMALAQRRAKFSSTSLTMTFDVVAERYALTGVSDPDHPARPYSVALSTDPYLSVILSAEFGGDATLVFDGYGMPDTGGTVVVGSGALKRTITLDALTGSVTISEGGIPNPPQLPV